MPRTGSRCCWSSATRSSASWAAPGCSPAARSTTRTTSTTPRPRSASSRRRPASPSATARRWRSRAGSRRAEVKIRFDTWFFVAEAPAGVEAALRRRRVRGRPLVPARGRARAREQGELMLVFPTIKHLEQLATFGSVAEALAEARERAGRADRAARGCARRQAPRAAARRAGLRGRLMAGAGLTVAVTGPTGDLGISIVDALERSRDRGPGGGHGPPPVRPGRARLAQDRVPPGRRDGRGEREGPRQGRRRGRSPRVRDPAARATPRAS